MLVGFYLSKLKVTVQVNLGADFGEPDRTGRRTFLSAGHGTAKRALDSYRGAVGVPRNPALQYVLD